MTFQSTCYGCGAAWSAEALALMEQIEQGGESAAAVDALNEATREHEGCFE